MLNSRSLLAFAFFSSTFFIIGCDKEENAADRRVSENIELAREAYYKKDGGPEKSHKLLEAAAKESTASNASKANAKAAVGQSNYAIAVSRQPELNAAETEALRVISDINRIGTQLADEVFLIDSLKGSNPSAAQSDPLKALSANKAKYAAQVADLDKNIQQLQTKKQQLTRKISDTDTEQKSKVEMGNELFNKSEAAKGQESVDLFKQSAEVRKAAGILARDLEFARLDLQHTDTLIADAQKERAAAEESVKTAQDQIQQLNQAWAGAEEAIKKRRAEASNLLTRAEVEQSRQKGIVAESGIAPLARQFADAKQRAADLRKQIDEQNLDPSIAAYDEADKFAKRLTDELRAQLQDEKNRETPVRVAWTRMQKLYNPAAYRLGKARSLQLRGQLFFQEENLLKSQQHLVAAFQPLFQRAALQIPAELAPSDLVAQLDTAHKSSLRDFSDAAGLLKDILELDEVQRNNWPQASEARELAVSVEYALHHLEPDKGHLDSARTTVKLLSDAGANFPALPPDLELRQITPVPIVAGKVGPTTAPTTNVQEGPAVTPEGAAALKNLLRGARSGGGAAQPQPPPPQPNQ